MEVQNITRFRLTVKGNVKMLTMMDSFATEGRYELSARGANSMRPELQEYVLEEKEVKLTDYFDPNTYQLIEYVNRLASIYNRQHICINREGAIKGLLNLPEIKTKWEELKKELMQVNPVAAFEVIRHRDREMDQPVAIIDNLSNTHFMQLFLCDYGAQQELPLKRQTATPDRMGIGFMMPVVQTFRKDQQESGYTIHTEALLDNSGRIDKGMITRVTGQQELDIKHFTRGSFQHTEDGVLQSAEMTVFEQLNEEYKSDLYLQLEKIG
ncbi:hypothetical protein SAMN05428949_0559 [Chitinophaga sp. YR627]|uniref:hypothetical protein n=1 Tax=Chitinophaga sp. YR627 TaxID=1881041 RepID=UPI0008E6E5B8|nr:hypothetical protein [Chitinophaga sp. YR627]SFM72050.1 hypothetical protein SAMN05428949_0559 [Chitinophaga sp. YR627]